MVVARKTQSMGEVITTPFMAGMQMTFSRVVLAMTSLMVREGMMTSLVIVEKTSSKVDLEMIYYRVEMIRMKF
jgi:hypothetical protein